MFIGARKLFAMNPLRRLKCSAFQCLLVIWLYGLPVLSIGADSNLSNSGTALSLPAASTNAGTAIVTNGTNPAVTNTVNTSASVADVDWRNCGWVRFFALTYVLLGTIGVLIYAIPGNKRRLFNQGGAGEQDGFQNVRRSNLFFLPVLHVALSAILLYFCCPALGIALLQAVAWFSIGTLLGLIFSVPKVAQPSRTTTVGGASLPAANASGKENAAPQESQKRRSPYETNNNLVEVSDWLTKIIVGLGLIHLKDAPGILKRAAAPLKHSFGESYLAVGSALILGFCAIGFLFGYVFTRLFLVRAFSEADPAEDAAEGDKRLQGRMDESKEAVTKSAATASEPGKTGIASLASPAGAGNWIKPFLNLAETYVQDRFPDIFQRVSHKNRTADEMAALCLSARCAKQDVANLLTNREKETSAGGNDGIIAGLASYILMQPGPGDLKILLSVALTAGRLHTRYRLIMAFRELLAGRLGTPEEFEQVRTLIQGWLNRADDDLRSAILALDQLIERRYPQ